MGSTYSLILTPPPFPSAFLPPFPTEFRCEDPCHKNPCLSCPHVSFDELHCHCGAQTLFPPIPCGQRPPPCDLPCARPHPCGHEPTHKCHADSVCPPCTVLMDKWCYGNHEVRGRSETGLPGWQLCC